MTLNGSEYTDRFFSLKKDNRTRGQGVTLVKDHCILEVRM